MRMMIDINELPHLTSAEYQKLISDTKKRIDQDGKVHFQAEVLYTACSIEEIQKIFTKEGIAWSIP